MTYCMRDDCPDRGLGRLDEDGICESCFREPEPESAPAPAEPTAGSRCPRLDCDGAIDEDGICDTCFRAAPAPPTAFESATAAVIPVWHRVSWESDSEGARPVDIPAGAPSRALARAKLGLGIVEIPPAPLRDPVSRLLTNPVVDERDRRCPNSGCRAEVGRTTPDTPGPVEGRCPTCGAEFSFRPALNPGDDLSAQYLIGGCLGYGGQGWVYLAYDRNLDDEPVAVKGLRGARNRLGTAMLAAEKRTLIEVRHPDIVDIRNFVSRPSGRGDYDVYIVLEFLAGVSLAEKMAEAGGVLPVAEAIAYVLGTLPALAYLHDSGLVYGDFKPPNVMQVGDRVKLLDMGAVTRIGARQTGRSWATRGFTAPEAAAAGPSIASDLYSVGRTLAALTAPFDMGGRYERSLPGPDEIGALARHESFYRFLRRATAPDPRGRFTTAAQMAEQLAGVLREVVALDARPQDTRPEPRPSALFTPERGVSGTDPRTRVEPWAAALALPLPRPDESDPLAGFLATVTTTEPADVIKELTAAPATTAEVALRRSLAHIDLGDFTAARRELDTVDADDWRRVWYGGVLDLARGAGVEAWRAFAAVRDALPGELAPKLALAACAESLGAYDLARHYYRTVWRTDETLVGAAFGVARAYRLDPAEDNAEQPVTVLEAVPAGHHHHVTARLEALRLRLERPGLDATGVREAARRLRNLSLSVDDERHLRTLAGLFEAARRLLDADSGALGTEPLLGVAPRGDAVGRELERVYLALRRHTRRGRARTALVRRAHAARPWTNW